MVKDFHIDLQSMVRDIATRADMALCFFAFQVPKSVRQNCVSTRKPLPRCRYSFHGLLILLLYLKIASKEELRNLWCLRVSRTTTCRVEVFKKVATFSYLRQKVMSIQVLLSLKSMF